MPLVNIPDAGTLIASAGAYSSPVFSTLLPVGLVGAGLLIGGMLVFAVLSWLMGGISAVLHGGRRRTGGRNILGEDIYS
jgi:hypothetical protein